MKITIVTVVFNGAKTIRHTIESVINQTYENVEYIVIDAHSTDNTIDIVNEYKDQVNKIISEPDNGLYHAINKGIKLASGDVIGFLHSDDFYTDYDVIQRVVSKFEESKSDTVFADLLYIKDNNLDLVLRYFSAKNFTPNKLTYGIMPPHPTFFVKKSVYEQYGSYRKDLKIASDYEMFVRLLYTNKVSYAYIHFPLVKMRVGGLSGGGLKNKLLINREVVKALKDNGINSSHLLILKKYPIKILEIIKGYIYNFLSKR